MLKETKIVHLCLGSFFADNFSYQENLLPKYHKALGYEVEVIASLQSFDNSGKTIFLDETDPYYNEYGIKVTRLPYKSKNRIWKKLKRYRGLFEALCYSDPNILFVHGCQFLDISEVVRFLKSHEDVTVYVDNHADFSNSAKNWLSKNILHKILWKRCARMINPYTQKFYGVLPARVDFLQDVYKLPKEKCELLVMGGDDELIERVKKSDYRRAIRDEYGVKDKELLIVTGGKINHHRPETLNLMEAIASLHVSNVKLLVFGAPSEELRGRFEKCCENDEIVYVGWIKSADTYKYFEAADLVVFPGLHSVMWEQAVAQGKPCVFRDLVGFHHVDIGGNAVFIKDVSIKGLEESLTNLLNDEDKLSEMRRVSENKGMLAFSYMDIAKRCIQ